MTASGLPKRLDALHQLARAQPWLGRFTLMNRLLLAMAFLPTGLVKATGQRFTTLPVENPVGFFFEAMYQSGPYWHFIGVSQIVAALLLLIPATATLGALLFLPIIVSIVLITWGIGFSGTIWITAGMLLSVIYLLCWDADRIWSATSTVLGTPEGPKLLADATWFEKAGWLLGGAVGIALLLVTRGFLPSSATPRLLLGGVGAAILVVAGWGIGHLRGQRRS
ncbi:MAG: hypothetical protein OEN56_01675 [Gemmatimonadota bacterium]|nr:hypothetical protein [Gemmatimonadota bacterium]